MPRPPILPPVDFRAIFQAGKTYEQWIAAAEDPKNAEKMEELRRAQVLEPAHIAFLYALPRTIHVVAFAEDWCGDVHRFVPVLQKIAEHAPQLQIRYVTRDEASEAFKRYLTNGGEAVPKFVFFNDNFVECGNWGPMPEAARLLIARGKAAGDVPSARKRVSAMYEADALNLQAARELMALIDIASTSKI